MKKLFVITAAIVFLSFMASMSAAQVATSEACWERKGPGTVCKEEVTGIEFVWIPAGCFQMGCVSGIDCDEDELPVHEVCVDGFWMGKYEVTQQQWQRITGKNPSYFEGFSGYQGERTKQDTSHNPVEQVSWEDVQEFLRKLNEKEGTDAYRLPTEAEWEYAARAGTQTAYSFGNDADRLGEYAWYSSNSGIFGPRPVGQLKPNAWGLYDMHGNVGEWCQDRYDREYYTSSPKDNPLGPIAGFEVVSRGGVWHHDAKACRSANRDNYSGSPIRIYFPTTRMGELGFRVVRTPNEKLF